MNKYQRLDKSQLVSLFDKFLLFSRVFPKSTILTFFCRADFVFMGSIVIVDTSAECQVLFLKVDALPLPQPKPCEIGYLYEQDCVFTLLAKLCNKILRCNQQEFQKKRNEGGSALKRKNLS